MRLYALCSKCGEQHHWKTKCASQVVKIERSEQDKEISDDTGSDSQQQQQQQIDPDMEKADEENGGEYSQGVKTPDSGVPRTRSQRTETVLCNYCGIAHNWKSPCHPEKSVYVTPTPGRFCSLCGKGGHNRRTCPEVEQDGADMADGAGTSDDDQNSLVQSSTGGITSGRGRDSLQSSYGKLCSGCGQPGHNRRTCPNPGTRQAVMKDEEGVASGDEGPRNVRAKLQGPAGAKSAEDSEGSEDEEEGMEEDGGMDESSNAYIPKCSTCGQQGHNRRTCTLEVGACRRARRTTGRNSSPRASPPPPSQTARTRERQSNTGFVPEEAKPAARAWGGGCRRRSRAAWDAEPPSPGEEACASPPRRKQVTAEEARAAAAAEEIRGQRDRSIAAIEEDAARAVARAAAEISAEAERAVKRVRAEADRALAAVRSTPPPPPPLSRQK
jgi:hypothetical protein